MTTQERNISHRALLIAAIFLGLILMAVLVAAVALHIQPADETLPAKTAAPAQPPEAETLPPPEANPYGPNDFQYDGEYLTCLAGESVLGIDVSEWQTVTDWNAVRDAGVEFVMIRVGYRGYGSGGSMQVDESAASHYAGAKAAGLKVGVYFFSQALTTLEAVEEAQFTLELIRDWELDMPVVFDWEFISDEARTAYMEALDLTHITMAFCQTIEDAGYEPMVYFNQNQSFSLLQMERLTQYDFWLAMYSERMTYPYKLDMWQYSCTGAVPGIEGDVDLNLWFPG